MNFLPKAFKLDSRNPGAFDHFFEVVAIGGGVVLADIEGGSSIHNWLGRMADDCRELNIRFTFIGVTTNAPASISATISAANQLPDYVDPIVVLNKMRSPKCAFRNWHDKPDVVQFVERSKPTILSMRARIEEFQTEARRHSLTLEKKSSTTRLNPSPSISATRETS